MQNIQKKVRLIEKPDYSTNLNITLYRDAKITKIGGIYQVEGKIIECRNVKNQIVDNGHIYIANRLAGKSVNWMRYIAVGTVSGGKGPASNALENEIARVYMTNYENGGTADLVYSAIMDAGTGTGNLVEAGIFDDQLVGNMFCWADFGAVNKLINDILLIEWTHTY